MTPALVIGGGQAGLAAADALRREGFRPTMLHAGAEPVGSWPHYYDSLELFTPAWMNALPGLRFPGAKDRFPTRDEVVAYLRGYAARLDCDIHTGVRASSVTTCADGFLVRTDTGAEFSAPALVAATGTFDSPHWPALSMLDSYTGKVLHAADYQRPEPFAGQRVVVVGAGNSAAQIGVELAAHANVTLASRKPVQYLNEKPLHADDGFWRVLQPLGRLPVLGLFSIGHYSVPVLDTGGYRVAIENGRPARTELFTGAEGTELRWADGSREHVDAIIFCTGYRPALDYLRPLGVLDPTGAPLHRNGMSTVHTRLGFIGLDGLRSPLSGSMHGVGPDARHVARVLRRRLRAARSRDRSQASSISR